METGIVLLAFLLTIVIGGIASRKVDTFLEEIAAKREDEGNSDEGESSKT